MCYLNDKIGCLAVSLLVIAFVSCNEGKGEQKQVSLKKPNIIYILADDLGYGDLSSYGQKKFQTPNIDKLAANGIKFTQHYSGSAVCAPSRSSLMTGQDTGHTPIRGNKEVKSGGQVALPSGFVTIAEVLKKAGYKTGAFGKWGLGYVGTEGDPNNQGFDEFYGYNDQKMAHRYYPPYLWKNDKKDSLAGNDWKNKVTYAQDKIQNATLDFFEANKDTSFFAYVPLVLPHAELIVPKDSIWDKFKNKYEERPWIKDNYQSDYGPDLVIKEYAPQTKPHAAYASVVYRIDVYVGQIIEKLEQLEIAENTIVIFTSDNGPAKEGGADPEFFNSNGGLRGVKRDLYEGGIRAPLIVKWPGKVKAGSVSDHISAFWDVMPTFAEIAGVETPKASNGISFLPTLLDEQQREHEHLYWEFPARKGRKAVRKGDWKGVVYKYNEGSDLNFELYNLSKDPKESNNVAENHPDIVKELKQIMKVSRKESELFPFTD